MYAMVCLRLDITHVVSVLNRFMINLGRSHWKAVKWLLRYIKRYLHVGLTFGMDDNIVRITSFADFDYACDLG